MRESGTIFHCVLLITNLHKLRNFYNVLFIFIILYYFKKIQFDEHLKADMKYVTQQLNDLGRFKNAQMEEVIVQHIL